MEGKSIRMLQMIAGIILFFVIFGCGPNETEQPKNTEVESPPVVSLGDLPEPPPMVSEMPPSLFDHLPQAGNSRQLSNGWNLVSLPIERTMAVNDFVQNYPDIQSLWKWNNHLSTWQTFPQLSAFPIMDFVSPDEGYWVRTRDGFEMTGTGVTKHSYSFVEGWNLIGYSHTASADQPILSFFEEGGFWDDSCGSGETIMSLWKWEDKAWQVYFPGDTATNHPQLDAFNLTWGTQFEIFTQLTPGIGFWLNSARNNYPPPALGCSTRVPAHFAQALDFIDVDLDAGEVSGAVVITKALDESDITHYDLYWGATELNKLDGIDRIVSLEKSGNNLIHSFPENTVVPPSTGYLLVYTRNDQGEMSLGRAVKLEDRIDFEDTTIESVPRHRASSIAFADQDPDSGEISGEVTVGRASSEDNITHYNLYWGANATTKLEDDALLTEIDKTAESLTYTFAENTMPPLEANYLLIFTQNAQGEMASGRALKLSDKLSVALPSDIDSSPLPFTCSTFNTESKPIADAGENQLEGQSGTAISLDASNSIGNNNANLQYYWQLIAKPRNSGVVLQNANQAVASLTPDIQGVYTLKLVVYEDGHCATDILNVAVPTPQGIVSGSWGYYVNGTQVRVEVSPLGNISEVYFRKVITEVCFVPLANLSRNRDRVIEFTITDVSWDGSQLKGLIEFDLTSVSSLEVVGNRTSPIEMTGTYAISTTRALNLGTEICQGNDTGSWSINQALPDMGDLIPLPQIGDIWAYSEGGEFYSTHEVLSVGANQFTVKTIDRDSTTISRKEYTVSDNKLMIGSETVTNANGTILHETVYSPAIRAYVPAHEMPLTEAFSSSSSNPNLNGSWQYSHTYLGTESLAISGIDFVAAKSQTEIKKLNGSNYDTVETQTTWRNHAIYTLKQQREQSSTTEETELLTFTSTATVTPHEVLGEWISAGGRKSEAHNNPRYTFHVFKNSTVSLNLTSGDSNVCLYLLDHANSGKNKSSCPQAKQEASLFRTLEPGTYTAVAASTEEGGSGTFVLNVKGHITPLEEPPGLPCCELLEDSGQWVSSGGQDHESPNNPKYTFEATHTHTVKIQLDSPDIDVSVYLLDNEEQILKKSTPRFVGYSSLVITELIDPGTYQVVVASQRTGERGNYTLQVIGDVANLSRIDSGITQWELSGTWASSGGQNRDARNNPNYSFVVNQDSTVEIFLDSIDTHVTLYLLDEHRRPVVSVEPKGFDPKYTLSTKQNLTVGNYIIVAATQRIGETGTFSLKVTGAIPEITPPGVEDTVSTLDTSGSWVVSGGKHATASNNPRFNFLVTQTTTLDIDLSSFDVDVALYLLDVNGHTLSSHLPSQGKPNAEILYYAEPGTYSIVAATHKEGVSGQFSLSLAGIVQNLIAVPYEDRLNTLVVTGTWVSSGGRDYFTSSNPRSTFEVTEDTTVQVTLRTQETNVAVYLLDSDGELIDKYDPNIGGAAKLSITEFLEPGTYTVVAGTQGQGITDSFTLEVSGSVANLTELAGDENVVTLEVNGSWTSSGGRDQNSTDNPNYLFEVTETTTVKVRYDSTDTLLAIYWLDSNRDLVDSKALGWPHQNKDITLINKLSPGTYRLVAATRDEGKSGTYRLRVTGSVENLRLE